MKPKILLWDIESSHNQVLTFGLYNQDIPHGNILTERHLFCVAYKWFGENKTRVISITDNKNRFKKNNHDDFFVLSEFRKVLEKADAQVYHYGDKFDLPMLNARLAFHNLPPLPKIVSFDTQKIASRYFKFNSNRLDYLAKFLGHKGKLDNPNNLWLKCFDGDIKAIKHMVKYNKQDIDALEFVFKKLMPFVKGYQLNMAMFLEGFRCVNPSCGSVNIEWRGYNYTRTGQYRRFVCRSCGSWGNERKTINDKTKVK